MHKNFQTLLNLEDPTCSHKHGLASYTSEAQLPIDGSNFKGVLTDDAKNIYRAHMYYLAIMDCKNEIYNVVGDNLYTKVMFHTHMTAQDSEFSYDH